MLQFHQKIKVIAVCIIFNYLMVLSGGNLLDGNDIPTSRPTFVVQSDPSSLPTVLPSSSSPSHYASLSPTGSLTETPTSYPSIRPTVPSIPPTSYPSTFPTGHISSEAPTLPAPTNMPSLVDNSAFPSNSPSTSSPSSKPSSLSTYPPTCGPSIHPSSFPSLHPTLEPTQHPSPQPTYLSTIYPTSIPSSQPSSQPSFMPTPGLALLGKKWWYLMKAEVVLHATTSLAKYTHAQVQSGVQEAFTFVLSDNVNDGDRSKLYTVTEVFHPVDPNDPDHPNPVDNEDDYYGSGIEETVSVASSKMESLIHVEAHQNETLLHYHVNTWCWTLTCIHSVRDTWKDIRTNPFVVVEPLHEQGIRAIGNVVVDSSVTTITEVAPPIPAPLSPTRIVYIILGVILFVSVTFFIIKGGCHVWEKKHIIRRWCRSRWENLSIPIYLCCYEWQRSWHRGFSLTSSSDDENQENSRDMGQLSVHYDSKLYNWQRSYLNDRDKEASQRLRPSSRDEEELESPFEAPPAVGAENHSLNRINEGIAMVPIVHNPSHVGNVSPSAYL